MQSFISNQKRVKYQSLKQKTTEINIYSVCVYIYNLSVSFQDIFGILHSTHPIPRLYFEDNTGNTSGIVLATRG